MQKRKRNETNASQNLWVTVAASITCWSLITRWNFGVVFPYGMHCTLFLSWGKKICPETVCTILLNVNSNWHLICAYFRWLTVCVDLSISFLVCLFECAFHIKRKVVNFCTNHVSFFGFHFFIKQCMHMFKYPSFAHSGRQESGHFKVKSQKRTAIIQLKRWLLKLNIQRRHLFGAVYMCLWSFIHCVQDIYSFWQMIWG